jgi:hypothetical protein
LNHFFITVLADQGWYVFIETSSPRAPNDKARLESQPVADGRPKCLTFWYHMFGPNINALNVYTKVRVQYSIQDFIFMVYEFFFFSFFCQRDWIALHLLRQAVASLETISVKEGFLSVASVLLKFGCLAHTPVLR